MLYRSIEDRRILKLKFKEFINQLRCSDDKLRMLAQTALERSLSILSVLTCSWGDNRISEGTAGFTDRNSKTSEKIKEDDYQEIRRSGGQEALLRGLTCWVTVLPCSRVEIDEQDHCHYHQPPPTHHYLTLTSPLELQIIMIDYIDEFGPPYSI